MARKIVWQDVVLMIGGFIFAPSLVISIINHTIIPIGTSLPTALALTAFVVCYITLKLRLAAFGTILTTICWYIFIFFIL
ncbi:hypothetical protein LCGC14_1265300 [marine sediment metagenome]|uniref:Uncharacterized protein n=1 Tax=marine sediment metagenome TaxID=412755 RepID=A0A0F9LKS2_9ZZZZ